MVSGGVRPSSVRLTPKIYPHHLCLLIVNAKKASPLLLPLLLGLSFYVSAALGLNVAEGPL